MAAGLISPAIAAPATPSGWFLAGSDPGSFEVSRDTVVTHDAKNSASLASTQTPRGFGTLMQSFDPTDYRGKRLKLTAWIKAREVKNWAGLWMRVDGADQKSTAFDNMQNRPIKGTRDWARYEIILDVAAKTSQDAFGILLDGEGKVWISNVRFQIVDNSVPTTGSKGAANHRPENLDFDH
jgi:hypothetical protein